MSFLVFWLSGSHWETCIYVGRNMSSSIDQRWADTCWDTHVSLRMFKETAMEENSIWKTWQLIAAVSRTHLQRLAKQQYPEQHLSHSYNWALDGQGPCSGVQQGQLGCAGVWNHDLLISSPLSSQQLGCAGVWTCDLLISSPLSPSLTEGVVNGNT